jgi:hypothetical protein
MKVLKRQYQLAAAVCLAAGFGSAQAAITPGSLAAQGAGSGELFMLAFNTQTNNTFAIDLGVTINDFLTNSASTHYTGASGFWDLGSKFSQFANGTGSIIFNLQASNFYLTGADQSRGALVSYLSSASPWTPASPLTNGAFSNTGWGKISNHADHINTAMKNQGVITSTTNYAENASAIFTNTGNTLGSWTFEGAKTLGISSTFSGSATVRSDSPDQTLNLMWTHQGPDGVVLYDVQNGLMSLDLSAGKLVWAVPPVTVPVPAAAWSFLGGLLAMLRLQRRTREA